MSPFGPGAPEEVHGGPDARRAWRDADADRDPLHISMCDFLDKNHISFRSGPQKAILDQDHKNKPFDLRLFLLTSVFFDQVLLKKFMTALTRGGPGGMPKPIEILFVTACLCVCVCVCVCVCRAILNRHHKSKSSDLRFSLLTSETPYRCS